MTRNNGKWMALGAVALAGMASPALADLKICNESGVQRTVAIGYKSGDVWTSEGWWILAPGECATTLAGALERRYYYYRAEDDDGAFEGEGYGFCVDSAVFTIPGDQDCDGRGFRAESFSQIDTGPEATTYTFVIAGDGPPALPETPPEPEAPAVAAAPTEPTEPAEPAEPAAPGDGFSSGSFGEPFTQ